MKLKDEEIRGICKYLVEYDPDIVEIVQFGSSVYAPEYAKDVDLLVITKKKKEFGGCLDCLDEFDFLYDIVVREVGEKLKSSFACHVLGAFKIIYGDGSYLREITKDFNPSFEEAKASLDIARGYMEDAKGAPSDEHKNGYIRDAFNRLFHAARLAAMVYLAIENTRWGGMKRRLSGFYRNEFDTFINTLHIDYFYNGNYPENYEEEFGRWYERVKEFVESMERESR